MILLSLASHMGSMICGYLTQGSAVEIVRAAATSTATELDNLYFEAAFTALLQLGFFGIGLILFVILFAINVKAMAEVISSMTMGS